jgi:hypothetical protein
MKIKSTLSSVLISIAVSLLGALIGGAVGLFLYGYYIPQWKHYEIVSLPGANDILQIDIQSTLDDSTDDTLYVVSENEKVYSNTLFQDNWKLVDSIPENNFEFPLCATEWNDHPPVKTGLVDSAGVRFERPLSTILRCYVLFTDGSLQVWTRSTDLGGLIAMEITSGLIGLVIGIIVSISIWRKMRNTASRIP